MKVSIINAVLNSQKIVNRQILHYDKMGLSSDVEVIFVDDGSKPPLELEIACGFNCRILETNDFRDWTQPSARNFGVSHAKGEYLILTDIDHIMNREVIDLLLSTDADLVRFKRYAGILDEDGDFHNDKESLKEYGFRDAYMNRLEDNGYRLSPHSNTFAIRRELYISIGGVSERYCGTGTYPNREEIPFKKIINPMIESEQIKYIGDDNRPSVYLIPNGKFCGDGTDKDYNPFGLFHSLKREGRRVLFKKNREFVKTHERTFSNNPG